ncbi:hypothetical protein PoB_005606500 [Plakobranchus ocellatus]|uniref:Uncharacterized protein n=1 Tax=Plakobranchus ocellatus TaxID=259542 RepID=A0AAV4CA17_9GAST|nr:hypothetical protein PoB_005606500 [Plakobranchus ocellatus]
MSLPVIQFVKFYDKPETGVIFFGFPNYKKVFFLLSEVIKAWKTMKTCEMISTAKWLGHSSLPQSTAHREVKLSSQAPTVNSLQNSLLQPSHSTCRTALETQYPATKTRPFVCSSIKLVSYCSISGKKSLN